MSTRITRTTEFCACCVRPCDTLCTSGFVDDVMFPYHGTDGPESSTTLCLEEFARWRYQFDVSHVTSDNYSV